MLIHVPVDQIDDNPFQKRQDYGDVAGLAADIAQRGLLQIPRGRLVNAYGQPVNPGAGVGNGNRVQLAFGHRRLRAFRLNVANVLPGMDAMPVYVEPLTDDQMLDSVWSENQHRSDINPIEAAELLAEKLERVRAAGGNQGTVAEEWRLDRSTVSNKLRLLDLPDAVRAQVRARTLSERQALALLSVVGLQERLNGVRNKVKWAPADSKVVGWGEPLAPADFMARVAAEPDKITSDDVRQYVGRVVKYAGETVPDIVAAFPVKRDDVVQPECKGCSKRFDQACLNTACLAIKKRVVAESVARTAADNEGVAYSDDPTHLADISSRDSEHLRALLATGIKDNLVIGYTLEARYKSNRLYDTSYVNDAFNDAGRKVVLLGHRLGAATEEELALLEQVVPNDAGRASESDKRPSDALLSKWSKVRQRFEKGIDRRAKAAVAEMLVGLPDELIRPLWALFARQQDWAAVGTLDELVANMWESRRVKPWNIDDRVSQVAAAGVETDTLYATDEEERLREICGYAAHKWYEYLYGHDTKAPAVRDACRRLDAWTGELPDDIAVMAKWLRRALAEAEAYAAKQEQPAAEAVETV